MPQTESFFVPGPSGRLEAVLMTPDSSPVAAAVVCHAHPLHGGMMHFKVVFRAAQALQGAGLAVLRFNFRGVGLSEGEHDHGRGERGDLRAALDEIERRYARLPLVAGGFSFGSVIAQQVAAEDVRLAAAFALGFPLTKVADTSFLSKRPLPRLFVQGEHDAFGSGDDVGRFVAGVPNPRELVVIPASDHFFTGHIAELQAAVFAWAQRPAWGA